MRSSRALTLAATAGLAVAGQVAVVDGNDSFAARRLEMAKLATKLVYNKVGKAGSSELTNVILRVRERQGLGKPPRAGAFYPTAERLVARLETLSAGDVYMNHAAHVRTNDSTFGWINLVREPIDRAQSLFYYFVDPGSRKKHKAEASERARRNDTTCGCAATEFDACILTRAERGCNIGCGDSRSYFCAPGVADCSVAAALRALDEDYVFVGLTEEYDLSVAILEQLLPRFFLGASAILHDGHAVPKMTSSRNPQTGTRALGAVSRAARKILMNTTSCQAEVAFYTAVKARFWLVASAIFGDELLGVMGSRRYPALAHGKA